MNIEGRLSAAKAEHGTCYAVVAFCFYALGPKIIKVDTYLVPHVERGVLSVRWDCDLSIHHLVQ